MNQCTKLLKTTGRVTGALFLTALFSWAAGTVARPGTVNYAEGQVNVDGAPVAAKALGSTEVASGQILQTDNGKAEMLLFPGAFLRIGQNSAVKMLSPSLTDTRVELLKGEALVEVDQIEKENLLNVLDRGADVRLEKKGIYSFQADQPMLAVYDGKAVVQFDDRSVDVGKGKELALIPGGKLKPEKFDRDRGDDLYAWSKLRSGYLSEANMASAQMVVVNNYPGWWAGTGWYWNPWFDTWAFVPGGGLLYSPFGYGFYSPAYWYSYAPRYYYPIRPGRTFIGRSDVGVPSGRVTAVPRTAPMGGSNPGFRGGVAPRGGFAPRAAAPAPSAPAFHPAPMGGGGVHFGGGRR